MSDYCQMDYVNPKHSQVVVEPAHPDWCYIIEVLNYWAKSDPEETLADADNVILSLTGKRFIDHDAFIVWSVHPDSWVDKEDGTIWFPGDQDPEGRLKHLPVMLHRRGRSLTEEVQSFNPAEKDAW